MREKLNNYLNRPFPLFLSYRQGRILFLALIVFSVVVLNLLQPFGLTAWHEFHKGLVLTGYIVLCFAIYGGLYLILSFIRPVHYEADSWTLQKELEVLLYYLPLTAFLTWIFALVWVPEFGFTVGAFFQLQYYNAVMAAIALPAFGFFLSRKIGDGALQNQPEPDSSLPEASLVHDIIQLKGQEINVQKLLFVECRHNDLHISFLDNDRKKTLQYRSSLRQFEAMMSGYPHLQRCHKSFMVNIAQVDSWTGCREQMQLQMKYCTQSVTVSRNFTGSIKQKMLEYSVKKKR